MLKRAGGKLCRLGRMRDELGFQLKNVFEEFNFNKREQLVPGKQMKITMCDSGIPYDSEFIPLRSVSTLNLWVIVECRPECGKYEVTNESFQWKIT